MWAVSITETCVRPDLFLGPRSLRPRQYPCKLIDALYKKWREYYTTLRHGPVIQASDSENHESVMRDFFFTASVSDELFAMPGF